MLIVTEPLYFGFEGNCCPTALRQTVYTFVAGRFTGKDAGLMLAGSRERPVTLQEATVTAFYDALSLGRLEDAYGFLSPAYQAGHPYLFWAAGYATTERIEVDARAADTPESVHVDLAATDRTADGGLVTSRFAGVWHLIPNAIGDGWLLDRAEIAAI